MNIEATSITVFGGLLLVWAIILLGSTVCLVIWGLALWHVIHFKDVPHRTAWLIAIILLPIVGATAYYFSTLLPYNREHPYVRPKKQGVGK